MNIRRAFAMVMGTVLIMMIGAVIFISATSSDTFIATETDMSGKVEAIIVIDGPWDVTYKYGDEVILTCIIQGIISDYTIEWEYRVNEDSDFISLECHEEKYSYILTPENEEYEYRVVIRY